MTNITAKTAGAKAKTAAKAPAKSAAKAPAKSPPKSLAKSLAKSPAKPAATKAKAPAKSSAKPPVKVARKKAAPKVASPSPDGKPARVKAPKASAKAPDRLAVVTKLAVGALEDMKAQQLLVIDVRGRMDVADTLIIASGTSDRHVKSLAANVVIAAKKAGHPPYGVEGERTGEWVLVDLHEVIVHVMLPAVREFYALEKLWEAPAAAPQAVKSRS